MALLSGKTAVITGGSTGIGLATARRFVEHRGARNRRDRGLRRDQSRAQVAGQDVGK
jgi:NAD(P)-dependent dehydrogenase (short-subunit alcohol dehydrogenase family)